MNRIMAWFNARRKAVVALVGLGVQLAILHWGTGNQWVTLAIAALTLVGLYVAPNTGDGTR